MLSNFDTNNYLQTRSRATISRIVLVHTRKWSVKRVFSYLNGLPNQHVSITKKIVFFLNHELKY